jgi:hypothetical protein
VPCLADTDCADANPCTADACPAGICVHTALEDGASCANADACDGAETCQAAACMAGPPLACDDGDACTIDGCEPTTGCTHDPASCDDQEGCTIDACDPLTGCRHAPLDCADQNPCTADACVAGACDHPPVDDGTSCADADLCDGAESCLAGVCAPGRPPDCDDHDVCTTDACDASLGCVHVTVRCDDGDVCTIDACDPLTGCTHTPLQCDDRNPCTADRCTAGLCEHEPLDDGVSCSDGDACDGVETCRAGVCTEGTPLVCDDGDRCTTDTCEAPAGRCVHAPLPECPACVPVPERCNGGADDDCDGLVDCADGDCAGAPGCVPPVPEICGDCIDNDGDGLVDYEDRECCPQPVGLGVKHLLLQPRRLLRLTAAFPAPVPAAVDPLTEDTSLQMSDGTGPLFCTTIAAGHWRRPSRRGTFVRPGDGLHLGGSGRAPGVFTFRDLRASFAGGLRQGRVVTTAGGRVSFRTHGRTLGLRDLDGGAVRVTLRTGDQCAQSTNALRTRKSARVFP